jgi:K(+)-stimulated pyrophosphate-energized sodium pump
MILAIGAGLGVKGVIFPLLLAAAGIVSSIIGMLFVRTREAAEQKELLFALRKGIFASAALIAVLAFVVVRFVLGGEYLGIFWAILMGLTAGIIIGISTEYFTSERYRPARDIAEAALTGPATVIIRGISNGMFSSAIPVLAVAVAIVASYYFAGRSAGGGYNFSSGLYGIGIAAVGMLSTLGITLSTDAFGPIADNAGGIAEMSKQPPAVRERTDALDALGNTTAATGKGFAIGSAALTALALIAAYRDKVAMFGGEIRLDLLEPKLISGIFIGAMLPFLFSALTMRAVGSTAGIIVEEVRRQFREIKGLLEGRARPDYARCVSICTRSAQKKMVLPALIAVVIPIAIGLVLGVEAVAGLLTGALASGFVLAIMMANCGGAWDNAKKYVEKGAYGGKGTPAHKALVVGDTVGDPFKDTSGPSLNILIKLMSMISLVFSAFVVKNALF